jgi:maltose phosphorylase
MSVVEGFAGMRVRNNQLYFNSFLPEKWNFFSFTIGFRGITLKVKIEKDKIIINNCSNMSIQINVENKLYDINAYAQIEINNNILVC